MARLINPVSDRKAAGRFVALGRGRGSAVASALHGASLGGTAESARSVPAGLGRNLNTTASVFGPVPLLRHETGQCEFLAGCKQLSSHTCHYIYWSTLDAPISGPDPSYEKSDSSIKLSGCPAVGFLTALPPDSAHSVAAVKAGLPKQAPESNPGVLAPDLHLGVQVIFPR